MRHLNNDPMMKQQSAEGVLEGPEPDRPAGIRLVTALQVNAPVPLSPLSLTHAHT